MLPFYLGLSWGGLFVFESLYFQGFHKCDAIQLEVSSTLVVCFVGCSLQENNLSTKFWL